MRKRNFLLIIATVVSMGLYCAEPTTVTEDTLEVTTTSEQPVDTNTLTDVDVNKLSEAFGHLIGQNLEMPGFKFNLENIIKGMKNAAAGLPSPMTEEEYELAITKIQDQAFTQMAELNLEKANNFMLENANLDGIVILEPGMLQYKVIQNGNGTETVEEGSIPVIHYTGKFIDGTVFGSSLENNEPITLPLNQAIPGFSKGVLGMTKGEKRTIYVHPDLGYGTSSHLPPNSLLIFDVELVNVTPPVGEATTQETEEIAQDTTSTTEELDNN